MIKISTELAEWLNKGGRIDLGSGSEPLAFYIGGNEIIYYFREQADGWVTVTRSERGGLEILKIELIVEVIDRYLYDLPGWDIRNQLKYPYLVPPQEIDSVAPGFFIDEFQGKTRLLDIRGGTPITVAQKVGLGVEVSSLVEFSYLLSVDSPEDIKASYCDPAGLPLASLFDPVEPPKTRRRDE